MSGFPPRVRKTIHERAGHCCEVCGIEISDGVPRSVHHRRPRGMGGNKSPESNSAAAGLYLCGSGVSGCHGWVESHRIESLALGLLVLQGHAPSKTPVQLRIGLVLLDDAGNYNHLEGANQ